MAGCGEGMGAGRQIRCGRKELESQPAGGQNAAVS